MQHFFYNLTIHNTLEPLLTNILYLNCFKLYIQIKWMTYQSPDAKEYQRLSWQHTWTGTNWKRKKMLQTFLSVFLQDNRLETLFRQTRQWYIVERKHAACNSHPHALHLYQKAWDFSRLNFPPHPCGLRRSLKLEVQTVQWSVRRASLHSWLQLGQ